MKRVAIIGSGISGLTCGYHLHPEYEVQLFEQNPVLGGHTATIDVATEDGDWAIDTGFIVFNDRTYPHFQAMMDQLGVAYQPTEMSFSVVNTRAQLIYNGHSLNSLFAQRRNLVSPRFFRFTREILRFNRLCQKQHKNPPENSTLSLGDFLTQHGFSRFFAENYILPMGAAIWSASIEEFNQFPLRFFLQFFHNHGLLNIVDRPQWFSIRGGSRSYIEPITRGWRDNIHVNAPVQRVTREDSGVTLHMRDGSLSRFEAVIFACHSDQALALLGDASEDERAILGAIPYRENQVTLHRDTRFLPDIKRAVASWNYRISDDTQAPPTVTYCMNILQCLPPQAPTFCVSLNEADIDPQQIIGQYQYSHPVFSETMTQAQNLRSRINGQRHSYFCGAYWYNGFHEDGVRSALDVCQQLQTT